MSEFLIRQSVPADAAAIERLYPEAFPDEDLIPLVRSLLRDPATARSLVALLDSEIVGHGVFTACCVDGAQGEVVLLGPLAVMPKRQRQGIGSAIVEAGLEWARESGANLVCVLGDPAYYGRFGFIPETRVEPPYALPLQWASAWQSQCLSESPNASSGKLVVPPHWREPSWWGP